MSLQKILIGAAAVIVLVVSLIAWPSRLPPQDAALQLVQGSGNDPPLPPPQAPAPGTDKPPAGGSGPTPQGGTPGPTVPRPETMPPDRVEPAPK